MATPQLTAEILKTLCSVGILAVLSVVVSGVLDLRYRGSRYALAFAWAGLLGILAFVGGVAYFILPLAMKAGA